MSVALAILRWFGLKAGAFALCALLALSAALWNRHSALTWKGRADLRAARITVLEAQRDAANAIAADYEARAARAVAAEAEAKKARAEAEKTAARRWAEIRRQEKAWAEQQVPERVWEELR